MYAERGDLWIRFLYFRFDSCRAGPTKFTNIQMNLNLHGFRRCENAQLSTMECLLFLIFPGVDLNSCKVSEWKGLTEQQHLCKRLFSFSLFPCKSAPQLLWLCACSSDRYQPGCELRGENKNAFCVMIMELIGPGNSGSLPRMGICVARKEREKAGFWKSRNPSPFGSLGKSSSTYFGVWVWCSQSADLWWLVGLFMCVWFLFGLVLLLFAFFKTVSKTRKWELVERILWRALA